MPALSSSEIIAIWEQGQGRHPADRALVLLSAACPGWDPRQLSSLPIGRRDACLMRLRESIFGAAATGVTRCPRCSVSLEFSIRMADLAAQARSDREGPYELTHAGLALKFRLPDSADLKAIAGARDVAAGRRRLLERCVLEASRGGVDIPCGELCEPEAAVLASHMAEYDPLADISLDLECAVCGHGWSVAFDVASFLWQEIDAQARRLLGEVHTLARYYGWSETEILALSAVRRNYYLEMAS